jgi:hypothetical protein
MNGYDFYGYERIDLREVEARRQAAEREQHEALQRQRMHEEIERQRQAEIERQRQAEADRQREASRQVLLGGTGYHTHTTNGKYLGKTETDSVGRLWHIYTNGKYFGKTER